MWIDATVSFGVLAASGADSRAYGEMTKGLAQGVLTQIPVVGWVAAAVFSADQLARANLGRPYWPDVRHLDRLARLGVSPGAFWLMVKQMIEDGGNPYDVFVSLDRSLPKSTKLGRTYLEIVSEETLRDTLTHANEAVKRDVSWRYAGWRQMNSDEQAYYLSVYGPRPPSNHMTPFRVASFTSVRARFATDLVTVTSFASDLKSQKAPWLPLNRYWSGMETSPSAYYLYWFLRGCRRASGGQPMGEVTTNKQRRYAQRGLEDGYNAVRSGTLPKLVKEPKKGEAEKAEQPEVTLTQNVDESPVLPLGLALLGWFIR